MQPSDDEQRILDAIARFQHNHSFPPSIRELARLCGYSTTGMHYRLTLLEAKGYITREPGQMRSVRVVDGAG